jgi:hypothetical protein
VGQGGFLVGNLWSSGSPLKWVYDCGSNQSDALLREIGATSSEEQFAFLFLSHLDSDHVSGVDHLLSLAEIREVVLPHLRDIDLAATIAKDLTEGRLTGAFLEFSRNVSSWLATRGVRQITFVRPGDDDSGEPGERFILPPEGPHREGPAGEVHADWRGPAITRTKFARSGAEIGMANVGAYLQISYAATEVDWILAPYAHRLTEKQLSAFRVSLQKAFGTSALKATQTAATTIAGRQKLRECYDHISQDHNLVSMSLYMGPRTPWPPSSARPIESYATSLKHYFPIAAPGWMGTGDANLARTRRRLAWTNYYGKVLDAVGVYVLPHHGSAHNFHIDVVRRMPHLGVAIATAGPNSYGHPHAGVRQAIKTQPGVAFAQVSSKPRSTIHMVLDLN